MYSWKEMPETWGLPDGATMLVTHLSFLQTRVYH